MSAVLELEAGAPVDARLDHAVVVVPDLERAAEGLAALGLDVRGGGRHDGHGTRNALVPLVHGYLEIITVEDPEAAAASPIGADVLQALRTRGGGLLGYAIEPADTGAGRALVDGATAGEPLRVGRTGPDGVATGWTMRFGPGQAMAGPRPFVISWDAGPPAPAAGPGATGVVGFGGVRVGVEPDLATWYRQALAPALGGDARTVDDAGPAEDAPPLCAVLLHADDPTVLLDAARAAGLAVDGGDVLLPTGPFGPDVRLAPRAPRSSSITPRTDTQT